MRNFVYLINILHALEKRLRVRNRGELEIEYTYSRNSFLIKRQIFSQFFHI